MLCGNPYSGATGRVPRHPPVVRLRCQETANHPCGMVASAVAVRVCQPRLDTDRPGAAPAAARRRSGESAAFDRICNPGPPARTLHRAGSGQRAGAPFQNSRLTAKHCMLHKTMLYNINKEYNACLKTEKTIARRKRMPSSIPKHNGQNGESHAVFMGYYISLFFSRTR